MNRREFGLRAAALAATPLAPALPASAAEPLSGAAARIYPWAAQYARVHGRASVAQIASVFNLPASAAGEVAAELVAKGITAPSAHALNPISWDQLYRPKPAQLAARLKDTAEKLIREADLQGPEEPAVKAARSAESEPTQEDRSTGSEESPPA